MLPVRVYERGKVRPAGRRTVQAAGKELVLYCDTRRRSAESESGSRFLFCFARFVLDAHKIEVGSEKNTKTLNRSYYP